MRTDLDRPISAAAFGKLVGISRQRVDQLIAAGTLTKGAHADAWLLAYCGNLRRLATSDDDGTDLTAQRRRFMAARANSAELDLLEREGEVSRTPETAHFVVDLVERLKQDARGLAPLIAGAVRDHPFESALHNIDNLFRATFDDALIRMELVNCEPPLALAIAIAELRLPSRPANTVNPDDPSHTGRKAEHAIADAAERELAEFKRKADTAERMRALDDEIATLDAKITGNPS